MARAYELDDIGGVILRNGEKSCYLQPGDDSTDFIDDVQKANAAEYPCGPFKSAEELIDYHISQYDHVMQ